MRYDLTDETLKVFNNWMKQQRNDKKFLYEHEVKRLYDNMIDECHEPIVIFNHRYYPSYVLKNTDEIVYEQGFNEYVFCHYEQITDIFNIEPDIDFYYEKDRLLDDFIDDNYLEICDECGVITHGLANENYICPKCGYDLS